MALSLNTKYITIDDEITEEGQPDTEDESSQHCEGSPSLHLQVAKVNLHGEYSFL